MKGILFKSIRQQHIIDWNFIPKKNSCMLLFWDSALFPLERFLSGSSSGQNKRGKKSRKCTLAFLSFCSPLQTEGILLRRPPTGAGTSPRASLSTVTYFLSLMCPWRWKLCLRLYTGPPAPSNSKGLRVEQLWAWWRAPLATPWIPRSHRAQAWQPASHLSLRDS